MPFDAGGYTTAAWLFLRGVGLTAVIAFLSLLVQARGLFGDAGIVPLAERLERLRGGGRRWHDAPSVFWLDAGERTQQAVLLAGVVAGGLVAADLLVVPALVVAFAAYLSFVNLGAPFQSYQWDVLLLETLATAAPLALATPPAAPTLLVVWVLSARLVFTSGAVKLLSGDPTWRDGTAMAHHYETQPLPTRWGWWAHQLPGTVQRLTTHAAVGVELAMPAAALVLPWPWRAVPLVILALLQVAIAVTGNYGFFNLLALVLLVPFVPDAVWDGAAGAVAPPPGATPAAWLTGTAAVLAVALLALNLLWLASLVSRRGWIRRILAATAPWRVTSQYGLFATMTTSRPQIVVEATADGENWHACRFRYQAVDPHRPPRLNAPHQPRLDWQLWFAALSSPLEAPWFGRFLARLVEGSPPARRLLADDPLEGGRPQAVRAVLYDYRFTDPPTRRATGRWWDRERLGIYHPPVEAPPDP